MNSMQEKTRLYSAAAVAGLQFLGGLIVGAIFIAITITQFVYSLATRGPAVASLAYLLVGAWITGLLFYCAVRTLSLASGCRKIIQRLKKNGGKATLEELSHLTGNPADKLARNIQAMIDRRYFPMPVQLDLYRSELLAGTDGPVAPPQPSADSEVEYKEVVQKPVIPIYALGITWILYSCLFPLHQPGHYIIAALLSLGVYITAGKITLPTHKIVAVKRAKPKVEPIRTGDKDVDEALRSAAKQLEELGRLGRVISSTKVEAQVQKLVAVGQEILQYVGEHTDKLRQVRQFLNYYLPTTVKLLNTYDEFGRQQLKGDNIRQSMEKIESMLDQIQAAFQKELDNLYFDKAIDVSADIDVMQAMLQREGIGAPDIQNPDTY